MLIFDLDGTLIDSRADLVHSVNAALEALGRAPLPEETVGHYVGDGAAMLMQRSLGLAPPPDRSRAPLAPHQPRGRGRQKLCASVDVTPVPPPLDAAQTALGARALELFLEYYQLHKLDCTELYPGVGAGLRALAAAGARLAVLTNKPVRPSREIVAHLGIADLFRAVYGGNSFKTKKPDPQGIRVLLEECEAEPRETVMIGDSSVDVLAGRNAGVWTVGVEYGFAPESLRLQPPDWSVPSFAALSQGLLAAMAE
ncbi:MAG: HAD-IA family hydrolase [Terriglobales bacterium]